MTSDRLRNLVAAASASPSVHNVQPARWRIDGAGLVLLEDRTRRLAVGDPSGHDAAISLGAAAEGLVLAAGREGLVATVERLPDSGEAMPAIARFSFSPGTPSDPLAAHLESRASWRGAFAPPEPADREAAAALTAEDRTVAASPEDIAWLAAQCDEASYGFMRNGGFRAELRGWMRLSRGHPDWARDGLNAEAMRLSGVEALGAGLVLGPLFRPLAALGLAPHLLAERKSFDAAAGVALFHRPSGEDPFESGRHFHRCWLALEAAGFGANVLAALADDKAIAARIAERFGIGPQRRLVSAFRFGRRSGSGFPRARLPLSEVLLS
ncbi:MAG TPA: hypothetical protein VFV30_03850, partial [Novosphingobium sp.]|nr:hypothetical protein [Novosphingobium sp.]